jgi:hypothetical protein
MVIAEVNANHNGVWILLWPWWTLPRVAHKRREVSDIFGGRGRERLRRNGRVSEPNVGRSEPRLEIGSAGA